MLFLFSQNIFQQTAGSAVMIANQRNHLAIGFNRHALGNQVNANHGFQII